jgi:hypothetical protein
LIGIGVIVWGGLSPESTSEALMVGSQNRGLDKKHHTNFASPIVSAKIGAFALAAARYFSPRVLDTFKPSLSTHCI